MRDRIVVTAGVLVAVGFFVLQGCGGGGTPTSAATPAPTPTLSGEPTTSLTGRWVGTTRITLDGCVEQDALTLDLEEKAGKVVGLYTWKVQSCACCGLVTGSKDPVTGTAGDGTLTLRTGGQYPNWTYSSTFDDTGMVGTVKGPNGQDRGTWKAQKEAK
jgi:hypothetical protein